MTLSTLAGPSGLIAGAGEPVEAGRARPLFHVVNWLAQLSDGLRIAVETSAPECVAGLGATLNRTTTLLLANLTPDLQRVMLPEAGARRLTLLDETWLRDGAGEPEAIAHQSDSLDLPAYAAARIDIL